MSYVYENKIIQIDKIDKIDNFETKEEDNKLCLICMDLGGEIILCSKCKYVYCPTCAEKINKLCSICFRNKYIAGSNQNYYDYYSYYDEYDELDYGPSAPYYFSIMASFVVSTIIGLCWIILFVVFGYIGIIFLLRIIFNLIHFYNIF